LKETSLQPGNLDRQRRRLNIFISYARADSTIADEIVAGLTLIGSHEVSIDRQSIIEGEAWKPRLGSLIAEADTVVFLLSTHSATSSICMWEVEESFRLSKRLLVALVQPLGNVAAPPQLAAINYVRFDEGRSFMAGLTALVQALDTDVQWLRDHTRLLGLALAWEQGGRSVDRLLSGSDIEFAKTWLTRKPATAPNPTELQSQLIKASEEHAAVQAELRNKAIEEREQLLKQAEQAVDTAGRSQEQTRRFQRRFSWALTAGFAALAIGLWSVWSLLYRAQLREAAVLTSVALEATKAHNYDQAMRVALHGLPPRGALPIWPGWGEPEVRGLAATLAGAAQASRLVAVLGAPGHSVGEALLSADGGQVVTRDRFSVYRWDARTGRLLRRLEVTSPQETHTLSTDGGRLLTRSEQAVHIIDTETGNQISSISVRLPDSFNGGRAVFSPDAKRVVLSTDSRSWEAWDAETGRLVSRFTSTELAEVTFSPDGTRVLAAARSTGRVIVVENGEIAATFNRPVTSNLSDPHRARFSLDGKQVSWFSGKDVWVWDANTGAVIHQLKLRFSAEAIALNKGRDAAIVAGGLEKGTTVLDLSLGQEVSAGFRQDERVTQVAYSPLTWEEGRKTRVGRFAVAYDGGTVRLWNASILRTVVEVAILAGHSADVKAMEFSTDGRRLLTVALDGTARLWHTDERPNAISHLEVRSDPYRRERIAMSADGSRALRAFGTKGTILESATGRELRRLAQPFDADRLALFSPDSRRLLTVSHSGAAQIWDVETGEALAKLDTGTGDVATATFSANGQRLVLAHDDGTARIWDASTGRLVRHVPAERRRSGRVAALSADGSRLVLASEGAHAVILDTHSGQVFRELESDQVLIAFDRSTGKVIEKFKLPSVIAGADHAAFSADGSQLATLTYLGKGYIWDIETGAQLATFTVSDQMKAMLFSPDGRWIIAGSIAALHFIDAKTGTPAASLRHGQAAFPVIEGLWLSPDAKRLVVSSGPNVHETDVSVLSLQGADLTRYICASKLTGAQAFPIERAFNPILKGLGGTNPCLATGPLSWQYWSDLWVGIVHSVTRLISARPKLS
jgi:WD40 repeat protein